MPEALGAPPGSLEVREGCTACGLCESVAPEVFRVTASGSAVRTLDPNLWERYLDGILQAERLCPSGAIRIGE
jgi:ferredoxin